MGVVFLDFQQIKTRPLSTPLIQTHAKTSLHLVLHIFQIYLFTYLLDICNMDLNLKLGKVGSDGHSFGECMGGENVLFYLRGWKYTWPMRRKRRML